GHATAHEGSYTFIRAVLHIEIPATLREYGVDNSADTIDADFNRPRSVLFIGGNVIRTVGKVILIVVILLYFGGIDVEFQTAAGTLVHVRPYRIVQLQIGTPKLHFPVGRRIRIASVGFRYVRVYLHIVIRTVQILYRHRPGQIRQGRTSGL